MEKSFSAKDDVSVNRRNFKMEKKNQKNQGEKGIAMV